MSVPRQPGAATFPRRQAETQRFTLGAPRSFTPGPERVLFLRSLAPDDPVLCLWALERGTGQERLVVDPRTVGAGSEDLAQTAPSSVGSSLPPGRSSVPLEGDLPPEERARRERVRESGAGIVDYAADAAGRVVAFTLGGRLCVTDAVTGATVLPDVDGPVVDPRPDPTGTRVAFVRDGGLWVDPGLQGTTRLLLAAEGPDVTWGLPEFVAAEEMDRTRGYWWSPDGRRLAVARVDVGPVDRWWIASPVDPGAPPVAVRYPAAGTANADVTLAVVDLQGVATPVAWDTAALPYLVEVSWEAGTPLSLLVQSRDQRRLAVLVADPDSGVTREVWADEDPVWVELVAGSPTWVPGDGALVGGARLLHVVVDGDRRRLAVDGRPVSPEGMHVRAVVGSVGEDAFVSAQGSDSAAVTVWRVPLDGSDAEPVTALDGVADGRVAGGTLVTVARGLDHDAPGVTAHGIGPIASAPAPLELEIRVEFAAAGDIRIALVLPLHWTPADGPLPVLMDPYGGPHGQRVLRARQAWAGPQWWAEQGWAVLVADGRGMPGVGVAWEQAVHGDLATPVLEDQVTALHAAAECWPGALDLGRVAIRGWSFGGFLAALAVLDRPDVFHTAIAGAPVSDQRLYDTHYVERYLGDPAEQPAAYDRSSLLVRAATLSRPLLIIHGLADDNVVVAHTLQLSRALLEAGRPHRVLPLSGVTHMTPQAAVAENLLHLELDFLEETLPPRSTA